MNDNTYNGWTNYETWSVHLERFDGMSLEDIGMDDDESDPGDIGDYLRDSVLYDIEDTVPGAHFRSILYQFMQAVNWAEIAEHIIDNSKE
jgi:hypothetical protein